MLTIEKQHATQPATLTDTATMSRQQPKLLDRDLYAWLDDRLNTRENK